MEHQPPHRYPMAGAVQWVPRHGMMNGLHMYADLMGTPGEDAHIQQRGGTAPGLSLIHI